MFSNIYSALSNVYNYIKDGIRNNPTIIQYVPIWFSLIAPSLFSNIQQLEYIKPVFTSIYDNLSKNKIDSKKPIITWITEPNMGSSKSKKVDHKAVEIKPAEKKVKEKIPSSIRDAVWEKYHGKNEMGVCYCCGHFLYRDSWHAAHVHSEAKGGKVIIENLRTSCQHCNLSCGDQNLYAYIRDKELDGPGKKNINSYFKKHPDQINSKRTNNWGKKPKEIKPIVKNEIKPIIKNEIKPIVKSEIKPVPIPKPNIINKPVIKDNVKQVPKPAKSNKHEYLSEWS